MTATATKSKERSVDHDATPPAQDLAELVHYTPEEVEANRWLPFTARTLRNKANAREIPHSALGGRITFRLAHIREIAAMGDTRPFSKPPKSA
ncbi:helix-turn-helix domain-containing protein [Streptomyces rimosus]|uniref:helix-turn-helix domain-containing protein n=1 Tax=Streptomyces rimosus TaxID=1927 RepID=UPI00067DA3C7|nr:helix-turn-helix domain-containing protein [Streptomyces rimosus]